jgi:hypothetical protein
LLIGDNRRNMRKKGSIKMRLFLFLFFAISFGVLVSWISRFYYTSKENIETELKRTDCSGYSFDVRNIDYSNNNLVFEIVNDGYASESLESVTVEGIDKTMTYRLPDKLTSQKSAHVQIRGITLNNSFDVSVNNCTSTKKQVRTR